MLSFTFNVFQHICCIYFFSKFYALLLHFYLNFVFDAIRTIFYFLIDPLHMGETCTLYAIYYRYENFSLDKQII